MAGWKLPQDPNDDQRRFVPTVGGILDGLPEQDSVSGLHLILSPKDIADIDSAPSTVTNSQGIANPIAALGRFAGMPPEAPAGVSVDENIRCAEKAIPDPGWTTRPKAYDMMFDLFPSGHEMDYKKDGPYRDFGNFNYGAFGSALGLTPYELHTGAGVQQMRDKKWSPQYGLPGLNGMSGDNEQDYGMIDEGIQYYQSHKRR